MDGRQVQDIFRRQHIVATQCSGRHIGFDLEGLETLGDLEDPVDIQGMSAFFPVELGFLNSLIDQSIGVNEELQDYQRRVRQGTLMKLYDASIAPSGFDKSLNGIGFPLPEAGVDVTSYATDVRAFHRTKHEFVCIRRLPTGEMVFGLAATTAAYHWWHIDSRGEATMVNVATGEKIWVVAEPRDPGYMWSTHVWTVDEVDVTKLDPQNWKMEAVLLRAGDRL
jgi:hypothetical protein